eukprot:Rhum_TRINITY_DN25066_c0_g1::Rhum_TRINITY_DN25066_c0_g1_i1::g.181081::m.181081
MQSRAVQHLALENVVARCVAFRREHLRHHSAERLLNHVVRHGRNQLPGLVHECAPAHVAVHLSDSHVEVSECKVPESNVLHDVPEMAGGHVGHLVPLFGEAEARTRTHDHGPAPVQVRGRRKVNAHCNAAAARHRVDVALDNVPVLRLHLPVRATEREDARIHGTAAKLADLVHPQPGARDDVLRGHHLRGARLSRLSADNLYATLHRLKVLHFVVEFDGSAILLEVRLQGLGDCSKVDNTRVRRLERTRCHDVGFDAPHLSARQHPKVFHAVLHPARVQLLHSLVFRLGRRNDELADTLMGDVLLLRVGVHEVRTLDAATSHHAARLVVHACMDNPRVVPRLVNRNGGLLLQHSNGLVRVAPLHLACRGKPDDAAAQDDDVIVAVKNTLFADRRVFDLRETTGGGLQNRRLAQVQKPDAGSRPSGSNAAKHVTLIHTVNEVQIL